MGSRALQAVTGAFGRESTRFRLSTATAVVWVTLVVPAWACERVFNLSHEQLLRQAKVIVRARAESLSADPGTQGVFRLPTRVRFRVLAVYKGALKGETLEFNGELGLADRPDRQAGYDFKQPRSYKASCFNTSYGAGSEYLLFLGPDVGIYSQQGELTPYWAEQEPTNERILGDRDPWLSWVVRMLRRAPRH